MAASEHAPSSIESSYDTAMRDFPLYRRALYHFVLAVLFVFSKLMWRWKVDVYKRQISRSISGRTS